MHQRTSAIPDGEYRTPPVSETATALQEAALAPPLLPDRPKPQTDSFCTQPTAASDPTIHYTVVRPHQITYRQVIVLVHGASHHEDCYLARWAPSLATRAFVVIAVSLRGHGHSTWSHSVSKARIADYVADVRRLLDDAVARGIMPSEARTDAVIVGHSLGSLVALAYAERYPLAGVVVGGPAIYLWIRTNFRTLHRFLTWRRWPELLRSLINPAALFATELLVRELLLDHAVPNSTDGVGSAVAADPADVDACRAQLQPAESRAVVTDMQALAKRGLRPLQTPHLFFLGGRFDVFFPPAIIAQSAASYREIGVNAQEVLVDGAHELMLDCREGAAEQAADALAAFAARCTTAAGM